METKTLTIGKDVNVISYSVDQKGYGRQGLYVELQGIESPYVDYGKHYVGDVYPNVLESYQSSYALSDSVYFDEDDNLYHDMYEPTRTYEESEVFDTVEDLLNAALKGDEVELEVFYSVGCRENGDIIEDGLTEEEAKELVSEYELEDEKNGDYVPNFYEIKEYYV